MIRSQKTEIKRKIKYILGRTIVESGLHHLLLRDTAVVVAFHRVNRILADDGLTCDVDVFEQYCRFFARNFNVVSLGSLVDRLENGARLSRELAITFDDGYLDNFENAAPVLKGMGLPATFFVVSRFIDTEIVPWWDSERNVRHSWMTWDHVRQLHEEGFEIGAHTRTHVNLGQVAGEVARDEILGSRIDLEQKLGARVSLFAYPYGEASHITEQSRDIVRRVGFRCCCSCFGGINSGERNPFYLRRIPISPWLKSTYDLGWEIGRGALARSDGRK